MSGTSIFDQPLYEQLNSSRQVIVKELISELCQPLGLRTAIDVGCGTGHFSGVLQSMGFDVQGADGRLENVAEAQRRFPGIRFHQRDAQDATLCDLGEFDLVFCFGLLYHLENPFAAVRHLKAMTSKLLLVESVIFPGDDPIMALVDEGLTEDQGLKHIAFYPTEACLVKMLYRAGFSNVYATKTQPDYPDYHTGEDGRRVRTMLAASFEPIRSILLIRQEEVSTAIVPWDRTSGLPNKGTLPKRRPLAQRVRNFLK